MSNHPPDISPEARRAHLNARWEVTTRRIATEVTARGTLAQTDLTEEEIARTAVEMSVDLLS